MTDCWLILASNVEEQKIRVLEKMESSDYLHTFFLSLNRYFTDVPSDSKKRVYSSLIGPGVKRDSTSFKITRFCLLANVEMNTKILRSI